MNNFKNQDCIDLILKESKSDPNFLDLSISERNKYFSKIDEHSDFERYDDDDKLVGFVSYYCNDHKNKEAFITIMLVDKDYRGRKIAQKLLTNVISIIQAKGFTKCSLEVGIENTSAIYLYKTFGFYEDYRDNDSIFMSILV